MPDTNSPAKKKNRKKRDGMSREKMHIKAIRFTLIFFLFRFSLLFCWFPWISGKGRVSAAEFDLPFQSWWIYACALRGRAEKHYLWGPFFFLMRTPKHFSKKFGVFNDGLPCTHLHLLPFSLFLSFLPPSQVSLRTSFSTGCICSPVHSRLLIASCTFYIFCELFLPPFHTCTFPSTVMWPPHHTEPRSRPQSLAPKRKHPADTQVKQEKGSLLLPTGTAKQNRRCSTSFTSNRKHRLPVTRQFIH